MVAVSPKYDTFLVFGLMNFLGLINFFENVPNPLISTFSSRATASVIDSKIISIELLIKEGDMFGNSFLRDDSMYDRVNVSFLILFTQL